MTKKLSITSSAPLRISFGGGGTDIESYFDNFGGIVFNSTINLYAHCTITNIELNDVCLMAHDIDEVSLLSDASNKCLLLKHIVNDFYSKFTLSKPCGIKIETNVDVLPGSGLGASSALICSILQCLLYLNKITLTSEELSLYAYYLERKKLNIPGGYQDQLASCFGGLSSYEISEGLSVKINRVNPPLDFIETLNNNLFITYLKRERNTGLIIHDQITNISQNENINFFHKIKEKAFETIRAAKLGQYEEFCRLINESWMLKKSTSNLISSNKCDALIDIAINSGADAMKVSGAGGGGYLFLLINEKRRSSVFQALNNVDIQCSKINLTDSPVLISKINVG